MSTFPTTFASLAQEAEDPDDSSSPLDVLADPVEQITGLETACDENPSWICEQMFEWTENRWAAGLADWFVAVPGRILVIVVVAMIATRVTRGVAERTIERAVGMRPKRRGLFGGKDRRRRGLTVTGEISSLRRDARRKTLASVARGGAGIVIWFIALIAILNVLTIQLAPLLAGAGIVGIALGFGAQNLVRDFLAGAFIILEDQYGVGDFVDLGEATGQVEDITMRVTRVRDISGSLWHVPNGEILRVANMSQKWARALLDVEVAYDTDIDKAMELIERTANRLGADEPWSQEILDAANMMGVETFGPDGIGIRVSIQTKPGSQWKVLRELRRRLKRAFDEEGIEIPFPQRTLWVRNEAGSAEAEQPLTPPDASPPR